MWDIVCDVWEWCLLQCFAITEISEMGLYDVHMFRSLYEGCCLVICCTCCCDMRVQASYVKFKPR